MKTKVLMDTDVLIDYLKGYAGAELFVENETREFFISTINIAELFAGIKNQKEVVVINEFLTAFKPISITKEIAENAGLLRKQFYKSHNIGLADALIAACAQSIDAVLITLNKKHFPMLKPDQIFVPYTKK